MAGARQSVPAERSQQFNRVVVDRVVGCGRVSSLFQQRQVSVLGGDLTDDGEAGGIHLCQPSGSQAQQFRLAVQLEEGGNLGSEDFGGTVPVSLGFSCQSERLREPVQHQQGVAQVGDGLADRFRLDGPETFVPRVEQVDSKLERFRLAHRKRAGHGSNREPGPALSCNPQGVGADEETGHRIVGGRLAQFDGLVQVSGLEFSLCDELQRVWFVLQVFRHVRHLHGHALQEPHVGQREPDLLGCRESIQGRLAGGKRLAELLLHHQPANLGGCHAFVARVELESLEKQTRGLVGVYAHEPEAEPLLKVPASLLVGVERLQVLADDRQVLERIAVLSCLEQLVRAVKLVGNQAVGRVGARGGKARQAPDGRVRVHHEVANRVQRSLLTMECCARRVRCVAVLQDRKSVDVVADVFPELNLDRKQAFCFAVIRKPLDLLQ